MMRKRETNFISLKFIFVAVVWIFLLSCPSPVEVEPPNYTVSYNPNGATSGTPPAESLWNQNSLSLLLPGCNDLAKTNCQFVGWNTVSNYTGTHFSEGDSMNFIPADIVLYAEWENSSSYINSKFVFYRDGDSSSTQQYCEFLPVDTNEYNPGDSVTILDHTKKEIGGKRFVAWLANKSEVYSNNAEPVLYKKDDIVTMGESNLTLYVQWELIEDKYRDVIYTVQDKDEESGERQILHSDIPEEWIYEIYNPNKTFYYYDTENEFIGSWNTEADGSGIRYELGQEIVMGTEDLYLYAQYVSKYQYSVIYHGNDADSGDVPVDESQYKLRDEAELKDSGTMGKSGYYFAGWNDAVDYSGKFHDPGEIWYMESDLDLYAVWIDIPASIESGKSYSYVYRDFFINEDGDAFEISLSQNSFNSVNNSLPQFLMEGCKLISKSSSFTFLLKNNGELLKYDGTEITSFTDIIVDDIDCGYNTIVFVSGSHVYVAGSNDKGALGLGIDNDSLYLAEPRIISMGYYGTNGPEDGGEAMNNVSSVSVCGNHVAALKNDGSVWEWGGDDFYKSNFPVRIIDSGVKKVEINDSKCFYQKEDGSLWIYMRYVDWEGNKEEDILVSDSAVSFSAEDSECYYLLEGGRLMKVFYNSDSQWVSSIVMEDVRHYSSGGKYISLGSGQIKEFDSYSGYSDFPHLWYNDY